MITNAIATAMTITPESRHRPGAAAMTNPDLNPFARLRCHHRLLGRGQARRHAPRLKGVLH